MNNKCVCVYNNREDNMVIEILIRIRYFSFVSLAKLTFYKIALWVSFIIRIEVDLMISK